MDSQTRNTLFNIGKVAATIGGTALNGVAPGIGTGLAIAGNAGLSAWQTDLNQDDAIEASNEALKDKRAALRKQSIFGSMSSYDLIKSNKGAISYDNVLKYDGGQTLLSGLQGGAMSAAGMLSPAGSLIK